jgi:hypothetical protein
MNRFVRLESKMKEAEEWPVIEVLSKFHAIHVDETIRRTFEVLRHVVFNWRGIYYAAIPLNGGEVRGASKEENEKAQLEAYLLNNLFTSFEREQIFKPVPVSMFTSGYVQKRLRQQRSKYAEVEAFRIFKFNNGAWPEMILSAIMGAAKRVEAEQRRLRAIQQAAEEKAIREQVEAERLAKRARRWRSFVDPLRREPPMLDDGLPDLGEVANDMTGKLEPALTVTPETAAEAATTAATKANDERNLDELTESNKQKDATIETLTRTIATLEEAVKSATQPKNESYRPAANGDAGGWMPGSQFGHATANGASAIRNLDEIRFSSSPSADSAPPPSSASGTADRAARARSYHEMADSSKSPRMSTPAQVIPMPYIPHVETPATSNGALAAKIKAPELQRRPLTDAVVEASARSATEAIAPIVEEVTPVEPIEEWAPAPGLGGKPLEPEPMSSLEDIRRFIDQSRRVARNVEAEPMPEPPTESVEPTVDGSDRAEPELVTDGAEDEHPTERAELNVPMITQWWTRKR